MRLERITRNRVVLVAVGAAGPGVIAEAVHYWLTGGLIGWESIAAALIGGIVVAATLVYLSRKEPAETSVIEEPHGEADASPPPLTPRPPEDDRTYNRRTVEELMSEVANLTSVAAQSTIQRHIGTWICVSGEVRDVFAVERDLTTLMIAPDPNQDRYVMAGFSSNRWQQTLVTLNKEDNITVVGKIGRITRYGVDLDDCEIVG